MAPRKNVLALIALAVLLVWSSIFAPTFRYPFFWDDFHCIRHYSAAEVLDSFHGWDDPDKMETPALRPVVLTLFAVQGLAFGENVVMHRIFLTALMWCLLFAVGLLLFELGCEIIHVGIIGALFVFSRAFATVNLWIILSSLVLAYVFMVLALLNFVRWVKRGRAREFWWMTIAALLAVFTREEAYVLSAAALIVWVLTPNYRATWRRALAGVTALLIAAAIHVVLRRVFIPEAPAPKLTADSLANVWACLKSAWLPMGAQVIDLADKALRNVWTVFLVVLLILFVSLGRRFKIWHASVACVLGVLFCSPSLAVAHSYGLTMPALCFMTAIAIAIVEVPRQLATRDGRMWKNARYAVNILMALGLIVAITGGVRRSYYVAESLHENCALKILHDATFLFDMTERPTTVPPARKAAARAHLATAGITNASDIQVMFERCARYDAEYVRNRDSRTLPFLPRYSYGAY